MPPFISYMCWKQLLYEFVLIPTTILQGGKLKGYRKHLTQNQLLKHLSQNSSTVTFKSSSGIAREIIHFGCNMNVI